MIKEGDKVVCIKEYEYVYAYRKAIYREGVTYEVLGIGETTGRPYIECDEGKGLGSSFDINSDSINSSLFSDYFVLLAEWRERQIKTVLDD